MENEPESKLSSLKFEPQSIDFGSLSPGKGASVMLSVYGGPGKVSFRSDQLKVSPLLFNQEEENVLEISLLAGVSGELIWDEVILQTATQEFRLPVTARWTERMAEATLEPNIEATVASPKESGRSSKEERTFKGKSCSLCGRNFGYNIDTGTWEQCECNWYRMSVNMMKRIIIDLRSGIKEIPSYLKETWGMVLGKEKLQ